jgi:hypothetical protein
MTYLKRDLHFDDVCGAYVDLVVEDESGRQCEVGDDELLLAGQSYNK